MHASDYVIITILQNILNHTFKFNSRGEKALQNFLK